MRSGFVTVLGRPNVGKSTLVNHIVGTKVSITSVQPNTTRQRVLGVLHRPDAQVVFVDTPGLHRPRTALGSRLNQTATASLLDADLVLAVLDATAAIGPGDRLVLERALRSVRSGGPDRSDGPDPSDGSDGSDGSAPSGLLVVVNKVDRARSDQTLERLATAASALEQVAQGADGGQDEGLAAAAAAAEFFPVSARTGAGVPELVDGIVDRLVEGPAFFPADMVTDASEATRVAELVREQLLRVARDELPHSIACRVTEWAWPHITVEILVERDSQKGIVIGKGGEVLKAAGSAVRAELPPGAFLELVVRVERSWQRREDQLDRLGY
ncbi:MAG TPA: GTPase Era [Acidimicrobiales bacterium]